MKPLLIEDKLHTRVKTHCAKKSIKIKDYINDLVEKDLNKK